MFKDFEQSIEIHASPDVVFAAVVRLFEESMSAPTLDGLKHGHAINRTDSGDIKVGSKWEINIHDPQQKGRVEVIEFAPPFTFTTHTSSVQFDVVTRCVVKESGGASHLSRSHQIKRISLSLKILSTFKKSQINLEAKSLKKLSDIKSLAESNQDLRV